MYKTRVLKHGLGCDEFQVKQRIEITITNHLKCKKIAQKVVHIEGRDLIIQSLQSWRYCKSHRLDLLE